MEEEEGRLQQKLVREVHALRAERRDREHETRALQTQVAALTAQLAETSDELERRMAFVAEAMTQVDALETQLAEAKRCLLSWEMKLQEGEDCRKALEIALDAREKQCKRLERECHLLKRDASQHERAQAELSAGAKAQRKAAREWKAKLKALASFADQVKQKNAEHHIRERELIRALRESGKAAEAMEKTWELRLKEKAEAIAELEKQCRVLQEGIARAERNRVQDNQMWEKQQQDVIKQHLGQHKQVTLLRERVAKMTAVLEKTQITEQLLRREVFRLGEELLVSESRRETEQRRQEQLIVGKQKEVAFIWQKYADVMAATESAVSH